MKKMTFFFQCPYFDAEEYGNLTGKARNYNAGYAFLALKSSHSF